MNRKNTQKSSFFRCLCSIVIIFLTSPLITMADEGYQFGQMLTIQVPGEISEPSYKMVEETTEEQQTSGENVAEPSEEPIPFKPAVSKEETTPRYTGTHILLGFKGADIRNILRLIAEVSNLNIVAGDDVQGIVTIRLTDVPWDQALDVILLSLNLGKTLEGNILRVAPIEKLNREKLIIIKGRETEEQLEPLKTVLIPISYAKARELKDVLSALREQEGK